MGSLQRMGGRWRTTQEIEMRIDRQESVAETEGLHYLWGLLQCIDPRQGSLGQGSLIYPAPRPTRKRISFAVDDARARADGGQRL